MTSTYIFPAQWGFTALAINVGDGMESREEDSLLGLPASHVDSVCDKEICKLAAGVLN